VSERLAGKVAVITGASSGIGADTARLFVAEGARVAVMARRADRLAETAAQLGAPDRVLAIAGDVSKRDDIERVVDAAVERFGGLDIMVSNAGIHRVTPFADIEDEEWDAMLATNLTGTFLACRAAARQIIAQGRGGAIVVVASTNGFVAEPGMAHYNASKGAVVMLTRSMAIDLAQYGIRANAVAPGTIVSEITRPMIDAGFGFGAIPAGRIGEGVEVAWPILFLASDEASYITGEVLVVDGGQSALNGATAEEALSP
jgi:NAD(P)-dependent dehydrogenase (short-subunit alcohol dehydrogenase family)